MYLHVGTIGDVATVSVRAFSYNPSAVFARIEAGETIEVTKHGKVIAVVSPPAQPKKSRYEELVESGAITPSTGDGTIHWGRYADVELSGDPLALLLELREDER